MMIEVLKTNVSDTAEAKRIIDWIHQTFTHYQANFDLQDCDHVLRIASERNIQVPDLISALKTFGFDADVLPDEVP